MDELFAIAASIAAFAAVMFGIGVGVNTISRSQSESSCTAFASETHRETKFVNYTYWDYDCITPASDGKWISTKALRDVN